MKSKPKRAPRVTPATKKLLEQIGTLQAELAGATKIINAMQTEIKQLTTMHRTQIQIIDNLSTWVRSS